MLSFLIIILLVVLIIILIKDYKKNVKINTINKTVKEENEKLEKRTEELEEEKKQKESELQRIVENIAKMGITAEEAAQNAENAFKRISEVYLKTIEYAYEEKENEYDNLSNILENKYNDKQDEIIKKITQEQKELDKIQNTRAAAIQAQIKEKEIKEQSSFYCLQPTEQEIDDIRVLERVKPKLHQPRILCMLIWSTYFQKPMTALCNNILGVSIVTGIYKITNQETNECYIGQAADVAKRWKDHAKCGLGIDTPANNKLYKAIQEYGIWNFSWELLEKCSKEELNEKEAFYIDLYKSKNYGYNSTIGVKKS